MNWSCLLQYRFGTSKWESFWKKFWKDIESKRPSKPIFSLRFRPHALSYGLHRHDRVQSNWPLKESNDDLLSLHIQAEKQETI